MKNFWLFLKSLFSNQAVMQLAVQNAAYSIFRSKPQLKPVISRAVSDAITTINAMPVTVTQVPNIIKSKVDYSRLPEPDRATAKLIVDKLIDVCATELITYYTKENLIGNAKQTEAALLMLGWVRDMAGTV